MIKSVRASIRVASAFMIGGAIHCAANAAVPGDIAPITTTTYEIRSTDVYANTSKGVVCVWFPFQPTAAVVTAVATDSTNQHEYAVEVPPMPIVGKTIAHEYGKTQYFIQRAEQKVCINYIADYDQSTIADAEVVVGPNNEYFVKYFVKAMK